MEARFRWLICSYCFKDKTQEVGGSEFETLSQKPMKQQKQRKPKSYTSLQSLQLPNTTSALSVTGNYLYIFRDEAVCPQDPETAPGEPLGSQSSKPRHPIVQTSKLRPREKSNLLSVMWLR
jgi:hypothetical protein